MRLHPVQLRRLSVLGIVTLGACASMQTEPDGDVRRFSTVGDALDAFNGGGAPPVRQAPQQEQGRQPTPIVPVP